MDPLPGQAELFGELRNGQHLHLLRLSSTLVNMGKGTTSRRFDARTDANQSALLGVLRSVGCKVIYLKKPLDLLASGGPLRSRNVLLEVKMPGEKLNKEQQEFWDTWPGEKYIIITEKDALEAVLGKEMLK